MPVHSLIAYNYSAIQGDGTNIYLRPDYDPDAHLIRLDVTEDAGDTTFDGDDTNANVGNDSTQYGNFYQMDGTPLVDGQVYLQEAYYVQDPGGSPITVWLVSSGGMPAVYLTSEPLEPATNYLVLGGGDVTSANAPLYSEIEGAPCFCAGTMIETVEGPRLVETLSAGSQVVTRDHGVQTLLWAGQRQITLFEHRAFPNLAPVFFEADSLAPGVPNAPLLVSQQHRLLIEGYAAEFHFGEDAVFVPARALVNGAGVRLDKRRQPITYHHFLLPLHAAVLSNGTWSESLLAGDAVLDALGFDARLIAATADHATQPAMMIAYPVIKMTDGAALAPPPLKRDVLRQVA